MQMLLVNHSAYMWSKNAVVLNYQLSTTAFVALTLVCVGCSGVRRKFSWGGLVQGHVVVIWCALF